MASIRNSRKGVSTVVGMTIFVLIFALVASYSFLWSNELVGYIENVKIEMREQHIRSQELLVVTPINESAVRVHNPTSEVVVVTQIWSGHAPLWLGQQGVAPYSNFTFPDFGLSQADGTFRVYTLRGNVFSGSYVDLMGEIKKRAWEVSWYWNTTAEDGFDNPPSAMAQSTKVGVGYFYELNFDWSWNDDSAVVSDYYLNSTNTIGFVAKAKIIKTTPESENATIRFLMDPNSRVSFMINGEWPAWPSGMDYDDRWIDSAVDLYLVIQGPKYSVHEVTVFYKTVGYEAPIRLRLNIANAGFYPL